MEEKQYYLTDIESGVTYPVSKERWEARQKAWDCVQSRISTSKGYIILMGTGGDMNGGSADFYSLWMNESNNFKTTNTYNENRTKD